MSVKRTISQCYCRNIRRAANTVTEIYDDALKDTGLTVNQYSSLINLSRLDICSISELADALDLERTTLVRTLKPLFKKNLIRDISLSNERNRKVTLTEEGKKCISIAQPLWNEAQLLVEHKIGRTNIEKLHEILCLLIE